MFALLVAIGALFLAVAISAAVDPWPDQAKEDDSGQSSMDGIWLAL